MLPAKDEKYASGFPKIIDRNKRDLVVNKRLKQARNRKGYSLAKTVKELKNRGIKSGVSTIQGYEADENLINHRYPSLYMLIELANLYDCSMDYIFGLTNEINRPSKDLLIQLENNKSVLWNGQEISNGERNLFIEKANGIMAL